jgi:8-oxo-dGTP diphosphatase
MDVKSFNNYNMDKVDIFGDSQVGPAKVLKTEPYGEGFVVYTNAGGFYISEKTCPSIVVDSGVLIKPHLDYTYVFDTDSKTIVDIAMSTVDLLIFHKNSNSLQLLAIKRGHPPFVGSWANPGGNIDESEAPIQAAIRELEEETSVILSDTDLKFIGKFDKPWRDPRSKICVSYAFACVLSEKPATVAQDDADDVTWLDIVDGKILNNGVAVEMAFDHEEIIKSALTLI